MARSAVFMVPITNRFGGRGNSSVGEYCRLIASSRYSSRKYSSPKTLARFARVISSLIKMYGVGGLSLAASGDRPDGSGLSVKPNLPPFSAHGLKPVQK